MTATLRPLASLALVFSCGLCSCGLGLEFANPPDSVLPTDDSEGDADTDADGDGDADADGDTDTDGSIDVRSVVPAYGTTAGNQTVTIAGGPFDASATVRFGANSATVQQVGSDELTVLTPSSSSEGSVDVIVSTDAGSGSAQDAFVYYEDGSGEAGVIGEVSWNVLLGDFWKDPTPYGYAWVSFTVPLDFHVWEWYAPNLDDCVNDSWTPSDKVYVYDLGVNTVTMRPTSGTASTLTWDDGYLQYANDNLSASQVQANTNYALDPVTSTVFPPFELTQLARTPASFTITSPSMTGTYPARVSRSSFNLQWSGSAGDRMIIMALMYNAAATAIEQSVYCVATDDGSFTIPSSVWSGFSSGRYIQIVMKRAVEQGGTLDFNNAESRVLGEYVNIGLLETQ